jgi:hypothetical protein
MFKFRIYCKVFGRLLVAALKGKLSAEIDKLTGEFDDRTTVIHFRHKMRMRGIDLSGYTDEEIQHKILTLGETPAEISAQIDEACEELKWTLFR